MTTLHLSHILVHFIAFLIHAAMYRSAFFTLKELTQKLKDPTLDKKVLEVELKRVKSMVHKLKKAWFVPSVAIGGIHSGILSYMHGEIVDYLISGAIIIGFLAINYLVRWMRKDKLNGNEKTDLDEAR